MLNINQEFSFSRFILSSGFRKFAWLYIFAAIVLIAVMIGDMAKDTAILVVAAGLGWNGLFFFPHEKKYPLGIITLVSVVVVLVFTACYFFVVAMAASIVFSWASLITWTACPLLAWQYFLLPVVVHMHIESNESGEGKVVKVGQEKQQHVFS